MQELDFYMAVKLLLSKLKWICLAMVIGAVLMGGYTKLMVADRYRSSCSFYVMNVSAVQDGQSISSSNLAVSRALVEDYMDILKTSKVVNRVAETLQEKGYRMTPRNILKCISMTSNENSALLRISVTTSNPHLSKAVCDAMEEIAPPTIKEVMMGMGTISVLDGAQVGTWVGPSVIRNAILGALIGFVLVYGLFLLQYLLDDTVHDESELKTQLDVTVLGSIPAFVSAHSNKGGKKRG